MGVSTYNGLGDRLQETANGGTTTFTMDLNTGLTQALSDGEYNYLYGVHSSAFHSPDDPKPIYTVEWDFKDTYHE